MKLETDTEVRSKNTPAIIDYRHRKENKMKIIILMDRKLVLLFSPNILLKPCISD